VAAWGSLKGTPAGTEVDGVSAISLTPEEYAVRMGIVNGDWGETSQMLRHMLSPKGRLDGESPNQARSRWERWVREEQGGFKTLTHLSITLDADSIAERINDSAQHMGSGFSEVTLDSIKASERDIPRIHDVKISPGQSISESIQLALANAVDDPARKEAIMNMPPSEWSDFLRDDIARVVVDGEGARK